MITKENRIRYLNSINKEVGNCIIYVISRDLRFNDNFALDYALKTSYKYNVPLVIYFNIYPNVKNRLKNHYEFMFNGLKKLSKEFNNHNITFITKIGFLINNLKIIEEELNPLEIVFDFSPLNNQRKVKDNFVKVSKSKCVLIDTHNVIPVWSLSDHEEYAAYTIRPKIFKILNKEYINDFFKDTYIPSHIYFQKNLNNKLVFNSLKSFNINPVSKDWDNILGARLDKKR